MAEWMPPLVITYPILLGIGATITTWRQLGRGDPATEELDDRPDDYKYEPVSDLRGNKVRFVPMQPKDRVLRSVFVGLMSAVFAAYVCRWLGI